MPQPPKAVVASMLEDLRDLMGTSDEAQAFLAGLAAAWELDEPEDEEADDDG